MRPPPPCKRRDLRPARRAERPSGRRRQRGEARPADAGAGG
jgi:hypothetical protein